MCMCGVYMSVYVWCVHECVCVVCRYACVCVVHVCDTVYVHVYNVCMCVCVCVWEYWGDFWMSSNYNYNYFFSQTPLVAGLFS